MNKMKSKKLETTDITAFIGGGGAKPLPHKGFSNCKSGNPCCDGILRKFGNLEVWKFGRNKVGQLWQEFTCPNFIFLQASKLPSCQTSLVPYCPSALVPSKAFTMAEILISLTIIGVIAAITLPSLQANINEKTWATQRKALYSRMSQAIGMMPSLNGYGVVLGENGIDETQTKQKAAQTFITDGLSKVFKISNICDGSSTNNLKKCGFPKKFTKMGTNSTLTTKLELTAFNQYFDMVVYNVSYTQLNTRAAAFETANGESILIYYAPNCTYTYALNTSNGNNNLIQPTMCTNLIYDLNGKKGPNKVGKDIGFMTIFYPTDSEIVAPYPLGIMEFQSGNSNEIFSIGHANEMCRQKYGNDARMANIEELKSVFININLGGYHGSTRFLDYNIYSSANAYSSTGLYTLTTYYGAIDKKSFSSAHHHFLCVHR